MKQISISVIVVGMCCSFSAHAGGLIGDTLSAFGNIIIPNSNIGQPLDDVHREFKERAPLYGMIEDGASSIIRNTSRELSVETGGPALAGMIEASRRDSVFGGVQAVPNDIRDIMAQFYGFDVAAGVAYRVGRGGDLAIASNAFRFFDAVAITLDNVIVFRDQNAFLDLSIWAHELHHVRQFREWGVMDFSKRYVRDHGAVERDAHETQNRFVQWARANNFSSYVGKWVMSKR